MNVLIGLDVKSSVLKVKRIFCSECRVEHKHKLKRNITYFTFMFIAVVPLYSAEEYLKCPNCKKKSRSLNKELLSVYACPGQACLYTGASMSKRAIAFIIDIFLLNLFNIALAVFLSKNPQIKNILPDNFILAFLPFWFLYFFISELLTKAYTPGKIVFSVKTAGNDNEKYISILRLLIRNPLKTICCLFPLIFCVAYFNQRNRALHYIQASSIVVMKIK